MVRDGRRNMNFIERHEVRKAERKNLLKKETVEFSGVKNEIRKGAGVGRKTVKGTVELWV
jgi:hypothetical protein